MQSNLDPGWLAVAQVYATLSTSAAMRAEASPVDFITSEGADAVNKNLQESRTLAAMAEAALRAAGVEG